MSLLTAVLWVAMLADPGPEEDALPRSLEEHGTRAAMPAEEGERDLVRRLDLFSFGPPAAGLPSWTEPASPAPQQPPVQKPGAAQAPPARPEDFQHPHDSFGDAFDTHFSAKAWREFVWEDYLTTPRVLLPLGFAVSAAAISHWDKTLEQHCFGVLGNRGWYSDAGQYALIGAVVIDGLLFPGEGRNWWDEAWTIGESYGAASLTAFVLKEQVKRPRPGASPGTGNGTHSFPSGHSTSSFTAATLIEANSGPLFGIPAYGLAGFVAFERVEEGRHYPSDVLAGAAIGALSAGIFDALHWGTEGEGGGGIGRPSAKLALDMDGLKGFLLSLTVRY
jgi:membrane-associated phospholipid phosphatase